MIKKITSNELLSGSISLFIMFNIFNFLSFVYQFLMARLLGPADFGILAVLTSLVYFIAIPYESVQTIVAKYSSKLYDKNDIPGIKYLLQKFFIKGIKISVITFVLCIPVFIFLSYYLRINFFLFAITGLMIFSIFLLPSARGVMQGMKKFHSLGINMVLESSIKLIIAVIVVLIGFGVYGAVGAIIISTIIAFFLSFIPLKKVFKEKTGRIDTSKLYSYSPPIILALIAILVTQSIDVIIAKNLFSDVVAGHYAVANLMGKIIFFATLAIAKTMFPLSSANFENDKGGKKNKSLFLKASLMVLIISVFILLIYLIIPGFTINLLFGSQYLEISGILLNIGIAFTFISLANLTLLYGISVNKSIKWYYLVIFVAVQVGLLYLMSNSLQNYSLAMLISGVLLFMGSLLILLKKS